MRDPMDQTVQPASLREVGLRICERFGFVPRSIAVLQCLQFGESGVGVGVYWQPWQLASSAAGPHKVAEDT